MSQSVCENSQSSCAHLSATGRRYSCSAASHSFCLTIMQCTTRAKTTAGQQLEGLSVTQAVAAHLFTRAIELLTWLRWLREWLTASSAFMAEQAHSIVGVAESESLIPSLRTRESTLWMRGWRRRRRRRRVSRLPLVVLNGQLPLIRTVFGSFE